MGLSSTSMWKKLNLKVWLQRISGKSEQFHYSTINDSHVKMVSTNISLSQSMWPSLAAIFFMTYFRGSRGGRRHAPWIRYWCYFFKLVCNFHDVLQGTIRYVGERNRTGRMLTRECSCPAPPVGDAHGRRSRQCPYHGCHQHRMRCLARTKRVLWQQETTSVFCNINSEASLIRTTLSWD